MSSASSLARKKRDRSARSPQQAKRAPSTALPAKPLQRLAAAHEACRAMLGEPPSAATLRTLVNALRQIFQAEIAVLHTADATPLEAISPRGANIQGWAELLPAPPSGTAGRPSAVAVEIHDAHVTATGVERIVAVAIDGPGRGALWLGYGKRAPVTSEELVMFDLLGDYLALTFRRTNSDDRSSATPNNAPSDDIVSQAAHDLRTPLTPIAMLLQTLERKAAAGTADIDSIGRARRQVQRLADMVSDLVDLSRLREGRLLVEPSVMDFREVCGRAAKAFGDRERRRTVELALGNEPLWIVTDVDRTVRAIASLFEHVARLAQGDAPLRANVERRDSHATLRIESERPVSQSGIRLETSHVPTSSSYRTPPLGLGVRLADALFARLGGNLLLAGGRDGSARVDGTFPLAPAPTARPAG